MANRREPKLQTDPAQRLNEVYRTMLALPLLPGEELDRLYEPSLNAARGADLTTDMARQLRRQHGGAWYKLFFYGSRGSGKSTEMSRLLQEVQTDYKGVRIDVRQALNPVTFEPHEILLAIAIAIARATADVIEGTEAEFDSEILRRIEDWFMETEYTVTRVEERAREGKITGGATLKLFRDFIDLGGRVTGTMQMNYKTQETAKVKRQALYTELRDRVNDLMVACTELLGASEDSDRDWLISIEDFDKTTPLPVLQRLVYGYAHIFADLQANFICNLPLGVLSGRNLDEGGIPFRIMYDTPVYDAGCEPYREGRESLRKSLARRMNLDLFAEGQAERLIVASGGGLRSLFGMASRAADAAGLRREKQGEEDPDAGPIEEEDVTGAINQERQNFRLALGEDLTVEKPITSAQKRERLKQVYERTDGHDTPDPVLNELLVVRAVQSFNGRGRYAVHPVVVDLLCDDHAFGEAGEREPGGLI